MTPGKQIGLIVALAIVGAGGGLLASMLVYGPGPLLQTEIGQRLVQGVMESSVPVPEGMTVARRGDAVPDLPLIARDGAVRTLHEFTGKRPLLVNFWASWCGPCVEEMPLLDRFAGEQGANGVQVIGIGLDDPEAVAAFLDEYPVDFTVLLDEPGPRDSSVQLGNLRSVLPFSVLIDADGRIAKQKIGAFDEDSLGAWAAD